MTPPGRRTPHGEDGFALIEVLVSALILAIVAGAVLSLLQATTRSAAAERQHAEAYALAQENQALLRSLRLSTLNRLQQTEEVTLDGTVFTVESQGTFINSSTRQPSNCTSGQTAADYVRITSSVSWYGSTNPVVMQSIVSPSNGSLDPNHGTLVITAKKVGGEALAGLGLKGTGAGTFSGTTDSTGCANFTDLPAGNYEVTPSGTGLVGTDGLAPHAEKIGVSAGTTTTLALQYDYGASIPVEFEYVAGGGVYKPAKLDSVYVQNTSGSGAYWTPTKARELLLTASPIYPFPSADSIWAGSCSSNNPETSTGTATYTFHSGETVTQPLHLKVPTLELTTKSGSSIVSGATIMITDENCRPEGKAYRRTYVSEASGHQSSASNGQPEYGLPYGTYEVCASAFISGHNRRVYAKKVSVKSFTTVKAETLELSSKSSEENRTCP